MKGFINLETSRTSNLLLFIKPDLDVRLYELTGNEHEKFDAENAEFYDVLCFILEWIKRHKKNKCYRSSKYFHSQSPYFDHIRLDTNILTP